MTIEQSCNSTTVNQSGEPILCVLEKGHFAMHCSQKNDNSKYYTWNDVLPLEKRVQMLESIRPFDSGHLVARKVEKLEKDLNRIIEILKFHKIVVSYRGMFCSICGESFSEELFRKHKKSHLLKEVVTYEPY